ncbi:MAG: adenylate/guanylate cyclase domain-containing protein [Verrucomicrobiae bacterium]|nr:adenylate/guanylate cyclase domain-containing protein [Verrucomicrobiae bacterium]
MVDSPLMPAELVNLETGEKTPLPPVTTMGRKKESTIFMPDQKVSRQHAIIRLQSDNEHWITDMGSFNGSIVAGQRVTTSRKLQHGDVIKIGTFQFRYEHPEQTVTRPIEDVTTHMTLEDIRNIDAVMLVSDIKGFTRMSEKLSPNDLAQVVGGFYKACNEIMDSQGATIDKFIGDAVLAYWPELSQTNLGRAVESGRRLLADCRALNEKYRSHFEGHGLSFEIGVGLHAGPVVLSPVAAGVQTILGDAVNLSFRLEALTRGLGKMFVLSEDFVAEWEGKPTDLMDCGEHPVKGREGLLRVFSIPEPV